MAIKARSAGAEEIEVRRRWDRDEDARLGEEEKDKRPIYITKNKLKIYKNRFCELPFQLLEKKYVCVSLFLGEMSACATYCCSACVSI